MRLIFSAPLYCTHVLVDQGVGWDALGHCWISNHFESKCCSMFIKYLLGIEIGRFKDWRVGRRRRGKGGGGVSPNGRGCPGGVWRGGAS